MHKTDFLIIGGGVIGLSIARRLKHLYSDSSVVILEKNPPVDSTPVVATAVCFMPDFTIHQIA